VTYLAPVDEEFEPTLNGEHSEHAWAPWNSPPGPLHPGVAATLASLGERRAAEEDQADDVAWRTEHGAEEPDVRLTTLLPLATRELHSPDSPSQGKGAADMAPQKWSLLRRLFGEWLTEEEREPEHVGEDEIKHDPATGQFTKGQSNAHKRLIRQGMEHKGTTSEGHQVYEHPDRDEQVRVKPNGSAYGRGPKTTKDESFEKVEHSLAHKKGVHDPKALAAWIGREHGKIPGKDTHLAGDRTLPLMSQDASGAWAYDSALLLASARRARARGRVDLARRAKEIWDREIYAQDAGGPPHDPKNGQFTSGQHSEQATYHRELQAHHESEAKKHGETSTSPYGSHGNAGAQHHTAAYYHDAASKDPSESYVKQAHRNTTIAEQASKKVAKAGTNYQTPESKLQPEKKQLTQQEQSAKRINAYLKQRWIKPRGRGHDIGAVELADR
jgi:hypothetical protein